MNLKIRFDRIKQLSYADNKTIEEIGIICKEELGPILNGIYKKKIDRTILPMLKRYFIIRSVTIIEDYFKILVSELIDKYELPIDELLEKDEISISLSQLKDIKKKNITRGRIIATNFNFQDPQVINKVISKLFDIHFFEQIQTYAKKHVMSSPKVDLMNHESDLLQNWNEFMQIFKLRHTLIHSRNTGVNYGLQKLDLFYWNLVMFLNLSWAVISYNLDWDEYKKYIISEMKRGNTTYKIGGKEIDFRDIYPRLEQSFPRC
ncbi:MAG: hypothetical protein ACREA3_09980 [Nitrosotalea sp.]